MSDNFYDDLEDNDFVPMMPDENGVGDTSTPLNTETFNDEGWGFDSADTTESDSALSNSTSGTEGSSDFWSNPSDLGSSPEDTDQAFNFDSFGTKAEEKIENVSKKSNLGYKSVGLIIAGLLIVLAIVISLISGAVINKDTTPQQTTTTVGSTQSHKGTSTSKSQSSTQTQSSSSSSKGSSTSCSSITEVNDGTIRYDSPQDASAIVSAKKTYVVGSSLVYDIELNISNGDAVRSYFCSKSAYDAVSVGSTVKVSYSVAQNGYIGINSVTK
jgi:hypothetical protein